MTKATAAAATLNKDEYNALIKAVWRLDQLIEEALEEDTATDWAAMRRLNRDRHALSSLFSRMAHATAKAENS
jgi:hypothetical protein